MSITEDATTTRPQTVLDRLLESGISQQRAQAHLQRGWVWLDGTIVTDPEHLAERPAHVELRNRPPYD
ncbi:MAG: hypothetical protein QOI16_1205 [Pseudonocardiales bacterium]|jgi:hypothetical protein|nr:hypothetical protein [Pseudonocardiales bacterium]